MEMWTTILAVASAIVLLSNAIEKIVKWVKSAKAPEQRQEKEIKEIKERLDKVERKVDNDKIQIADIREGNHAITKGVLALLEHGINGNNIQQMKDAKHDVEEYLINH